MKKERMPWFPCEPSKLIGALSAMRPHIGYTYWMVCLRIYEIGGPCPDTIEVIARRTGYNKRIVVDALEFLFATGKLVKTKDGIMNPYAERILYDQFMRVAEKDEAAMAGALAKWGVSPDRINKMKRSERLAAAKKLGTHTEFEWMALVTFCGRKCLRCGLERKLIKDHIRPLYQGGSDAIENLQPLCQPCNSSKGPEAKDLRPTGWENAVFSTNDACVTPAERLPDACVTPAHTHLHLQETEDSKQVSVEPQPDLLMPWPKNGFDEFISCYPRKIAKLAAKKAFDKVARHPPTTWAKFIASVKRYAEWAVSRGDPKFVKHPATWLNAGCWDDEPDPAQIKPSGGNRGSTVTNSRTTRESAIIAGVVQVAHQLVGNRDNRWPDQKVSPNRDANTDGIRALEFRGSDSKH